MAKGNDQEVQAGANYIVNFYNEAQNIKVIYSEYMNLMLEIEQTQDKSTDLNKKNMSPEILGSLKQALTIVRQHAVQAYISYNTITKVVKKVNVDPSIEDSYNKIKAAYIIKRQDLENFAIAINLFLCQEVLKELLDHSQNLISEIFKNEGTERSN